MRSSKGINYALRLVGINRISSEVNVFQID